MRNNNSKVSVQAAVSVDVTIDREILLADRDMEIISLLRKLKKMAGEDDFDQVDFQDRLWRTADQIQTLIDNEL